MKNNYSVTFILTYIQVLNSILTLIQSPMNSRINIKVFTVKIFGLTHLRKKKKKKKFKKK
jgi:hypothetical protein